MRHLAKLLCIGCVVPVTAGALFSCAAEENQDERPSPSEVDAGGAGDAFATSEAAPEHDADAGPPRCSTSKLCISELPLSAKISLGSIWGSSKTDVWAVGNQGTVVHYDGTVWEAAKIASPDGAPIYTLRSVWLERADDVWIADGNHLRHTAGWKGPTATEWSFFSYPIPADDYVTVLPTAVHGNGNTVWVGNWVKNDPHPTLERFEGWVGGAPKSTHSLAAPIGEVRALAMARQDEVWVAGSCAHLLSRGCVFRATLSNAGDEPVWEIEELDARTSMSLAGAWTKDDTVWLVGEGGTIRRMTASTLATKAFESVPSPVTTDLNGIFGFGPNDVWAVGEASTVLHWNGTSWSKLATPFDDSTDKPRLLSVWGSSPADVWIAGDGVLLHFQENEL